MIAKAQYYENPTDAFFYPRVSVSYVVDDLDLFLATDDLEQALAATQRGEPQIYADSRKLMKQKTKEI